MLDDRAQSGLFVRLRARLDLVTRVVTWTFTGIDPDTGDRPADATRGFLPPNVTSPEGQGFVSFSVRAVPTAATGDTVVAQASIVFDGNLPIATNTDTVVLDAGDPTADPLVPATSSASVPVTLGVADDSGGSGPGASAVFVSRDGGAFTIASIEVSASTFDFTGVVGSSYRFLVRPRDLAGNEGPLSAPSGAVVVQASGGGGGGTPAGGGSGPPPARAIDDSCPADDVDGSDFEDVSSDNVHFLAIDCVSWWDIADGLTASRYGPAQHVTRAQMASFIANLIEGAGGTLPADAPNRFPDDDGSVHAGNIDRLAAAGIVTGRADGTYDPDAFVTRAQMATFIVRAYQFRSGETLPPDEDAFGESLPEAHATAIRQAAGAGFTGGLADGTYGSQQFVRRDQMASFLARVLDLLVEGGFATPPA